MSTAYQHTEPPAAVYTAAMSLEAVVGVAVCVLVIVLVAVVHHRDKREVERAKKSRWATWRDQPLTWKSDRGRGGLTRDDGCN